MKTHVFTIKMRDMINIHKVVAVPYSRLETSSHEYIPVIPEGCCLNTHGCGGIPASRAQTFSDLCRGGGEWVGEGDGEGHRGGGGGGGEEVGWEVVRRGGVR